MMADLPARTCPPVVGLDDVVVKGTFEPDGLHTAHAEPARCTRGALGGHCPACADVMAWRHSAILAIAEATDYDLNEAMHWLAEEHPHLVIQALEGPR